MDIVYNTDAERKFSQEVFTTNESGKVSIVDQGNLSMNNKNQSSSCSLTKLSFCFPTEVPLRPLVQELFLGH